jgi:hypothetical protein
LPVFSALLGFIDFGVWAVVLETGFVMILEIISYLCFLANESRIAFIGGKLQIVSSDFNILTISCFVISFLAGQFPNIVLPALVEFPETVNKNGQFFLIIHQFTPYGCIYINLWVFCQLLCNKKYLVWQEGYLVE